MHQEQDDEPRWRSDAVREIDAPPPRVPEDGGVRKRLALVELDTSGANSAANKKKWLRTPVFGPGDYRCYECGRSCSLSYFSATRACICGSRRFIPE